MSEPNYEDLLQKYIRHVVNCEGVDFVTECNREFEPDKVFTPDEWAQLMAVAEREDARRVAEWEQWKAEHPAPKSP